MPDPSFQPIPSGIRVAVRNAVGGSGLFTTHEIFDLFESHSFVEQGEVAAHIQGSRTGDADKFQASINWGSLDDRRRYLLLIEDVLAVIDKSQSETAPGYREAIERALSRSDIDVGGDAPTGSGSSTHSPSTAQQEVLLAGDDLWDDGRVRVFISHTSGHRARVGELAESLRRAGFSCFVAHNDIKPSRGWLDTIQTALGSCDVLVAYVTDDFSQSDWTDQEVGWALGANKLIVPIDAGAVPYGFFGSYQAVSSRNLSTFDLAHATAAAITEAVCRGQRPHAGQVLSRLVTTVVEGFIASRSYDTTRLRFELLSQLPADAWTPDLAADLRERLRNNGQITTADVIREVDGWVRGPEAVDRLLSSRGYPAPRQLDQSMSSAVDDIDIPF